MERIDGADLVAEGPSHDLQRKLTCLVAQIVANAPKIVVIAQGTAHRSAGAVVAILFCPQCELTSATVEQLVPITANGEFR